MAAQLPNAMALCFKSIDCYKATKMLSSKLNHSVESFLPEHDLETIQTMNMKDLDIVTATQNRLSTIWPILQSVPKISEIIHYFRLMMNDEPFLTRLEMSNLALSDILIDNYLTQVRSEGHDYEEFKARFLTTLVNLEKEEVKVAVQQILESSIEDEVKHSLLDPQYREILNTQEPIPSVFHIISTFKNITQQKILKVHFTLSGF